MDRLFRQARWGAWLLVLGLATVFPSGPMPEPRGQSGAARTPIDPVARMRVVEAYGHLPLIFEANVGQSAPEVQFLSRGPGYTLFLTRQEAVLTTSFRQGMVRLWGTAESPARERGPGSATQFSVVRLRWVGSTPQPRAVGLEALPGRVNYFTGSDRTKWRTHIPTYARVRYQGLYPGVDLEYYRSQGTLEYDLQVAPGADPERIKLRVEGAERLEVDAQGDLVLHLAGGEIRQRKPVIYQRVADRRRLVAGGYVLVGPREVGVRIGPYDAGSPLIIDPVVLAYSTYLGGSGFDEGFAVAVDAARNAYVTGGTASSDFPITPGAFQTASGGGQNVFVTKLNAAGQLVYSTYLGGSRSDSGLGITVDTAGNAYVTGFAGSINFPTTPGAFQLLGRGANAFVTKISPTGSALVYSTYLGGSGGDQGNSIALDGKGDAYVVGYTASTDFPTTAGAFKTVCATCSNSAQNAFVTKLNATGTALIYSTYLGGSGFDQGQGIAVDSVGNAYVTGSTMSRDFPTTPEAFQPQPTNSGEDAFVTKLNTTGSALVYSTYLGGSGADAGYGIVVDAAGNAYVTGSTLSVDFPITPGAFQTSCPACGTDSITGNAFVTKLNATGSALVYSTYLGGSQGDEGRGIVADAMGNAYITGYTSSTDFPTTPGAFQPMNGGSYDAFVSKLNATGSALVYSTFLGGNSGDIGLGITVDAAGNAYVTGFTTSTNFPTRNPLKSALAGSVDAFIARVSPVITVGLYNPSTSTFFLRNSNTGGAADLAFPYGPAGANLLPLAGQWIGPGVATVGLYDSAAGSFFMRTSNNSGIADLTFSYGPAGAGWIPLVGDWTGQGKVTVGLYDPLTSTFYLRNSNSSGVADLTFSYGPASAEWIPLVGDWTGQGKVTVGLYDPVTGTFYLRNSNSDGVADLTFSYGPAGAGWIPLVGDWTGQGKVTVGLYDPVTSTFYLRNSNSGGVADITFGYGPAGASPPWHSLAGVWTGF